MHRGLLKNGVFYVKALVIKFTGGKNVKLSSELILVQPFSDLRHFPVDLQISCFNFAG